MKKFICLFATSLAACTPGQPTAPMPQSQQAASAPQVIGWDAQPHSLDIRTITPATRCEFTYRADDGTYVGLGLAYGTLLLVISRTGQVFPETVYYDVQLRSPQNTLTLKMRPDAGQFLMTPLSFGNDPNHVIPSILQAGFTLTVSSPNAGVVLVRQIPPPNMLAMLPFQVCVSMTQSKMRTSAPSRPATP